MQINNIFVDKFDNWMTWNDFLAILTASDDQLAGVGKEIDESDWKYVITTVNNAVTLHLTTCMVFYRGTARESVQTGEWRILVTLSSV